MAASAILLNAKLPWGSRVRNDSDHNNKLINVSFIWQCANLYSQNIQEGIYFLKVNNWIIWTMFEICSKLTIKTQEIRNNISAW